ncbi:MAG: NADH-quinone oxidoreductase subunit D [Deltaproteobacteria bacterium]|nr:NADH-quinone oxidoreductase subunit D [Deltaproteobacteria bacterium]
MAQLEPGLKTEDLTINMGPQHPSTHGVLRIQMVTDGEIVKKVTPYIGYLHRCFEKHSENVDYMGVMPYVDRLDYVASMNNDMTYAMAVEKLGGYQVPERAQYIRVIMAELNRIASHLLALGTYGLDVGAFTPFMWCFRDREKVLDIFEQVCGARLLYNYMFIGGVSHDLTPSMIEDIKEFCDYFEPKIDDLNQLLSYNQIFVERTANVGVIPLDVAISYGLTGPNLRGSGKKWDLRKNMPYSLYDRFDFDVPVGRGERGTVGDCWDRYMVRVREMGESLKIVRQAVAALPPGEIRAKLRLIKPPAGEIYFRTDNPRGELGFYIVSDGTPKPYRVKCKSPCFTSISILSEISPGCMVADLVAIIGSIDVVMGEVDR